MVYDVNKRASYDNLCDYWLKTFREVSQESAVVLMVGNQTDRCQINQDVREVPTTEAKLFAE